MLLLITGWLQARSETGLETKKKKTKKKAIPDTSEHVTGINEKSSPIFQVLFLLDSSATQGRCRRVLVVFDLKPQLKMLQIQTLQVQ